MNDRFKFRAWDKALSRMHHFDDVPDYDDTDEDEVYGTPFYRLCEALQSMSDDVILMQSTGLRDKNGKLIFEGDVLGYRKGRPFWEIFWKEGGFRGRTIKHGEEKTMRQIYQDDSDMEIIGNIYENPELLKKDLP